MQADEKWPRQYALFR